jgi:hypothetical protein
MEDFDGGLVQLSGVEVLGLDLLSKSWFSCFSGCNLLLVVRVEFVSGKF